MVHRRADAHQSIYAKLGVNKRRAAVRRAGELDLLSRSRDR